MPGALPSGGDPSQYDLGDYGASGTGISGLANRTEENVTNEHKARVQGSPNWRSASTNMFAGLFADGVTPFPVLLISALFEAITGLVPGVSTVIELVVDLGDWLADRWADLLNVGTYIEGVINTIVQAVTGLPVVGDFLGELADAVNSLWGDAQDALSGLGNLAWDLLHSPAQVIGQIPRTLINGLEGILDGLGDAVNSLWGDTQNALTRVGDLAWDLLHNPLQVIGQLPRSLISGLDGILNDLGGRVQGMIDGVVGGVGGAVSDFVSTILGIGNLANVARTGLDQIGQIVSGIVVNNPISQAITQVANWFAGLLGFQNKTVINQEIQQNFTITAASQITRQQAWVYANHSLSAVSYPAILNTAVDVWGRTEVANGHFHEIDGNRADAYAAWWYIYPGDAVGAYLTIPQAMVLDRIALLIHADEPISNIPLQIFRERSTGSLDRIFSYDIGPFIKHDFNDAELTLIISSGQIVAKEGERYVVRIVNNSDSDIELSMKGLEWDTGAPDIGHFGETPEVRDGTWFTPEEALAMRNQSNIIPWIMLGSAGETQESRTWSDDFKRDELGTGWWGVYRASTTGRMVIVDGELTYSGTTNGFQQELFIQSLATDDFRIDATITGLAGTGSVSLEFGERVPGETIRLSVRASGVSLHTFTGGTTLTQRASVNRSNNNGQWTLYFESSLKRYTVLFNNEPIGMTWTDTGNIVQHGEQYRWANIRIERVNGVNAGRVDDFTLRDWKP